MPLLRIAHIDNLKKPDPAGTIIIYSENGQTGEIAATMLNLLANSPADMVSGMMEPIMMMEAVSG